MDYKFKGTFSPTVTYMTKDVVSYVSANITKYYMCLRDNTVAQSPLPNGDSSFWGMLNADSNFPNAVDTFLFKSDIQSSEQPDMNRYILLKSKTALTPAESNELNQLATKYRNKFNLADDVNKVQDSLSNLQLFYKDKIDPKLEQNVLDIDQAGDNAIQRVNDRMQDVIDYMDGATAGKLQNQIGLLADLSTTDKTNLVKAINEVNNKSVDLSPVEDRLDEIEHNLTQTQQNVADLAGDVSNVEGRMDTVTESLDNHIANADIHVPRTEIEQMIADGGGSLDHTDVTLRTWVDAVAGSDTTGDGSEAKPYKTLEYVIDNMPKYHLGMRYIYLVPNGIHSFSGSLSSFHGGDITIECSQNVENVYTVLDAILGIRINNCTAPIHISKFDIRNAITDCVTVRDSSYVSVWSCLMKQHGGNNPNGVDVNGGTVDVNGCEINGANFAFRCSKGVLELYGNKGDNNRIGHSASSAIIFKANSWLNSGTDKEEYGGGRVFEQS